MRLNVEIPQQPLIPVGTLHKDALSLYNFRFSLQGTLRDSQILTALPDEETKLLRLLEAFNKAWQSYLFHAKMVDAAVRKRQRKYGPLWQLSGRRNLRAMVAARNQAHHTVSEAYLAVLSGYASLAPALGLNGWIAEDLPWRNQAVQTYLAAEREEHTRQRAALRAAARRA